MPSNRFRRTQTSKLIRANEIHAAKNRRNASLAVFAAERKRLYDTGKLTAYAVADLDHAEQAIRLRYESDMALIELEHGKD